MEVAFRTSPTTDTEFDLLGIIILSPSLTSKFAYGFVFNSSKSKDDTILPTGSTFLNLEIKLKKGARENSVTGGAFSTEDVSDMI